jgi:acetyl esterase/lipase
MSFSESKTNLFRFLFCGFFLLIAACTSTGLAALNLPSRFSDRTIVQNISYGSQPWEKLDIYAPQDAEGRNLDVVVFFYGGRWEAGAKEDFRFAGDAFAKRGFIAVIPDYRKYPAVKFPAFVEDGAKAVSWVYDHIAAYGGNPTRIHVAGHSAGAHIGALLAADGHYLAAEGKSRDIIFDFAGLAGPYDFTPEDADLKDIFGPPENYPKMRITSFIDGKQPPMLLLYGDADTTVKRYNLERLQNKIRETGGCGRSIAYSNLDHIDILVALSWAGGSRADVAGDMVKFFREPKNRTCGRG